MNIRLKTLVTPIYQIALALILISAAQVAYVTSEAFSFFLQKGYAPEDVTVTIQNFGLGTAATFFSAVLCLIALPRLPRLPVIALLPFLAFVGISTAWSSVPVESLSVLAKIVGYSIAICYLVSALPLERLMAPLVLVAISVALASAYLVFVDPDFKDTLGVPGWRGAFAAKNTLGAFSMYMFILILPFSRLFSGRRAAVSRVVSLLLLALAIASQSKTATAIIVMYYVFSQLLLALDGRSGQQGRRRAILWVAFILWVLVFTATMSVVGFGVSTGDVTFTGRTRVWDFFWQYFLSSPVLGIGGYSLGLDESIAALGNRNVNMPTPDSSYIIMLANQGIIGATLYLTGLGFLFASYYRTATRYSYLGFCGLLAFVAHGTLESGSQFSLSLGLMVVLFQATLSRKIAEQERLAPESGDRPAYGNP